jgi:hypothetical protein
MRVQWVTVFFLCSLASFGQQPATGSAPNASSVNIPVSGVVNGHVYLGDTKTPARKATVYLQPAAALREDGPPGGGNRRDNGITISIETSFDGSYSFSHVPFGSYYVVAVQPGYISPFTSLSVAAGRSEPGDPESLGPERKTAREVVLKSIPQVDVQSSLPISIDVVLERGGAISGTIVYDDGSPGTGLEVSALIRSSHTGKESWNPVGTMLDQIFDSIVSDDRGNYRISGLPAGKYIVLASLSATRSITYISAHGSLGTSSNSNTSRLEIYSGSTPRMKDASSFSITLGEERSGEDIQIPLNKLHTISGNFVSALDGHMVNSGQAALLNADDKSFVAASNATEDNPGFVFYFVYEGDYILSSAMSADVNFVEVSQPHSDFPMLPEFESQVSHFYGSASEPLHVAGDMSDVTIAVPEITAKEAQTFKGMQQPQEQ